jgi:hypothetical protein
LDRSLLEATMKEFLDSAAIGAAPASYICYQDVNRDPM